MGAGASAQFGPALDACAAKPADGSDLRDFNTAKAEAVQLRRTLAALRYQVNAQGQGASACFEHLHDGMQQWTHGTIPMRFMCPQGLLRQSSIREFQVSRWCCLHTGPQPMHAACPI